MAIMSKIKELLLEQLLKKLEECDPKKVITEDNARIRQIIRKYNEEDGSLGVLGTIPTPALGIAPTGTTNALKTKKKKLIKSGEPDGDKVEIDESNIK
jgi:hypothetical protein